MDLINELKELVLATRLKRLSERFTQDVSLVYKEQHLDFEPRWFPVFYVLLEQSPSSIMDIAKAIGVTHPAINQIANEMIRDGLVIALKDETDKRKRLLSLTDKAYALVPNLKQVWKDIGQAVSDVVASSEYDVLAVLASLEALLDEKSFYARINQAMQQRLSDGIQVIEYQPAYREAFKALNLAWIQKYFVVEAADERVLSNPETEILAPGGHIFLAQSGDQIVGTAALIKVDDTHFELAKMAVSQSCQGQGIGKKLLEHAIQWAKARQLQQLTLETNSSLAPALHLYRKVGFVRIPFDADHPTEFERADVRMQLDLTASTAPLEQPAYA